MSLPVFSVDTVEQARDAQVLFCRRGYAPHPEDPGEPRYIWTDFAGTLEAMDAVTEKLRAWWNDPRRQKPAPPDDAPLSLREHCRRESGLEGVALDRYINRHYGHG